VFASVTGAAANAKDYPDVRVISYVSREDAKTVLTMAQAVKARKLVIPIERKLLLFIRVGLPGHRERCTLTTP
jgi:hypothetical protein